MSESSPSRCPECQAPLKISVMRSSRSEDLLLECPVCGYTAFTSAADLGFSLRRTMEELFDQVSKISPFNLARTLRDPRHSVTDKLITLIAKLGSAIMDYKTLLALVLVFARLFGRRGIAMLVAAAVMSCMVLYRDVIRKRMEQNEREDEV
jgi:hypothetical protein